ncbi:MAG: hypothetical protein KDN19_07220 [Verrucomicrobiae bacterium]|nr:hypothetical protein [Verrucomicrobiae bacterium]
MNEPNSTDHSNESESAENARDQSPRPESREAFADLGAAVKRAWNAGAADAREAAKQAVPKTREEFARGFHDLAWGAAYLIGFGAAIAREIAPECVNQGWDEGVTAGQKAGVSVAEKCRQSTESEPEGERDPGVSGSEPNPGSATPGWSPA